MLIFCCGACLGVFLGMVISLQDLNLLRKKNRELRLLLKEQEEFSQFCLSHAANVLTQWEDYKFRNDNRKDWDN